MAKKKDQSKNNSSKKIPSGKLIGSKVLVSDEKEANTLYQKSFFGEMKAGGKLNLSLIEALYLLEKEKLDIIQGKKKIKFEELMDKAVQEDPLAYVQYVTYDDLRERGYIVKTGFKFGAHFRIYNRGDIPGEAHSSCMVHCLPENFQMSLTDISRIVRLGHSVKKKMWIAAVDNEGDLTYYEVKRIKP